MVVQLMEMIPMMILIIKDGFLEFVQIFVMLFIKNAKIQQIPHFLQQTIKELKLISVNQLVVNHLLQMMKVLPVFLVEQHGSFLILTVIKDQQKLSSKKTQEFVLQIITKLSHLPMNKNHHLQHQF